MENLSKVTKAIKPAQIPNLLLSQGVATATTEVIAKILGIPKNQVSQRMAPLKLRGEIITPAKGLWVPVPPEYLAWGAPAALDLIAPFMSYFGANYYVGWLSAAELHGASHHAPQVFQVATDMAIRDRTVGRTSLRFFQRSNLQHIPVIKKESKNGLVRVSSKEATLLDITTNIRMVAGIDNAANLVVELCDDEDISMNEINRISDFYPAAALRRLGWLMENFTAIRGLEELKAKAASESTSITLLDPLSSYGGSIDQSWCLQINRKVEPDV
ncbi:MAG: type IV toxin-antitoxin system AbiEi family antitoxin [Erysipelotrichaceae bacterium]|jgi:predicted transcriptional regulator of viral defense system|nr:type IV toxin-antitoxin system AbiEi family antitoxin [Erysipelotrichaceae bacterium]